MIKIRHDVFETNSSSSHSLVYRVDSRNGEIKSEKKNYHVDLYDFYGDDEEKGILAISFGSYGWDGDPLSDFRHKLSYLLTQNVRGFGLTYYGHTYDANHKKIEGAEDIEIHTQEDWDNVIENYVLKEPKIVEILNFIKEKCPNIKGFKFCWYDNHRIWDIEEAYKDYMYYEHNTELKRRDIRNNLPEMDDPFFHDFESDYNGHEYLIGFGGVDHQSAGLTYDINYLDKYLFDDNLWVIITNDNR